MTKPTPKKRLLCGAGALALGVALLFGPGRAAATGQADVHYTRQQLARLLEQGLAQGAVADYAAVAQNTAAYAPPQGMATLPETHPGAAQAQLMQQLLADGQFLEATVLPGGVAVYTAFDTQARTLLLACANLAGQDATARLAVEGDAPLPGEVSVYTMEPVAERLPAESDEQKAESTQPDGEDPAATEEDEPVGDGASVGDVPGEEEHPAESDEAGQNGGGGEAGTEPPPEDPAPNPEGAPTEETPDGVNPMPPTPDNGTAQAGEAALAATAAPAAVGGWPGLLRTVLGQAALKAAPPGLQTAGQGRAADENSLPPTEQPEESQPDESTSPQGPPEASQPEAPQTDAPAAQPQDALPDSHITGFEARQAQHTRQEDTGGAAQVTLPPWGVALVRLETGLLHGGRLPTGTLATAGQISPAAFSPGELQSGNAVPGPKQHGLLRLYSVQDPSPGHPATGDWATYSASDHAIKYDVDATTLLQIEGDGSSAYFTVELHNTAPVTLAGVDSTDASHSSAVLHFRAEVAGAQLLLQNPAGRAVAFARTLLCTGPGQLAASGQTGVYADNSGATIRVDSGFSLQANGTTYGVLGTNDLNLAAGPNGAGTLAAVASDGMGLYTRRQLNLAAADVSIQGSTTGTECNRLNQSGGRLATHGGQTGLVVNDDMELDGAATLAATADAGGTAATVDDEMVAKGLSLFTAQGGAVGLTCDDLRTHDGSQQYATAASVNDTAKTRVVAHGTDIGVRVGSDNEIGSGTLVLATGGNTGYYGEHFTLGSTSARRYGTLIARGTGADSIGLSHGTRYKYITHGIRVVAIGGKYGVYCPGSYDYIVRYNSQLIAIGGEMGMNVDNPVWSDNGSYIYARGGTTGIRTTRSFVTAYGGHSTVVAIGGVEDGDMQPSPFLQWDELMNAPFEPEELPRPKLGPKNLLPFKAGTYGISTLGGGDKIESEDSSRMFAYGGEYGAYSGSFLEVSHESRMELYGGRVGGQASSHMRFWGGGNILRACGEEIGLETAREVNYGSGNNNYIYGYGQRHGINAETLSLSTNGYLVAESEADGSPGLAADHPHALPALNVKRNNASINISNNAVVHELYTVHNYDIVTLPPFALNAEMAAVGSNMGTNPDTLLKLNWTTPENPPSKADDGRDYLDYDPGDDQKLIKAGTASGLSGLIAYGSMQNATLVGQSIGSARQMVSGAQNNTISSSSGTSSQYRITLQLVNVEDLSTMNVRLDLAEAMLDEVFALGSVPADTVYQLEFTPVLGGTPATIDIENGGLLDADEKSILLPKLREGDYRLVPRSDIGWPYNTLPQVHFRVHTDTTASVPEGMDYGQYWSKRVQLVAAEYPDGAAAARLDDAGSPIGDGSGSLPPAFAPTDTRYDIDAFQVGTIRLLYRRLAYPLDFRLLDVESRGRLPGSFAVRPRLGGQPVPGLAEESTVQNTGTATAPRWRPFTVFAGLEYTFEQQSVDRQPYLPATGTFTALVAQGPGGRPKLDTQHPNDNYETHSNSAAPYMSLYVLNDVPVVEVPLYLIDAEAFAEVPQRLQVLQQGMFRLEAVYQDGTTADVTTQALVPQPDGSFTVRMKPGRDAYVLTQTKAPQYVPPSPGAAQLSYQRRRASERFCLEDVVVGEENGAPVVTSYTLRHLGATTADSGWVVPQNHDGKSLYITNETPARFGTITVQVDVAGLWQGQGSAVFLVQLHSNNPQNPRVYTQSLVVPGADELGAVTSGEVIFDPLPEEEFTITVTPALRCGATPQSGVLRASATEDAEKRFAFAVQDDAYYAWEDEETNRFLVDN